MPKRKKRVLAVPKKGTKSTEMRKTLPQVRAKAKTKGNQKGEWIKVINKRAKKQQRFKYALSQLLSSVEAIYLTHGNGNVTKIPWIQKGSFLFELKEFSLGETNGFRT